jgi:drug/metabolite transporter (DMT)-like permease
MPWLTALAASCAARRNEVSFARIVALTSLAMIAFAGNSLLCRVALKDTGIDAASFTTIRLVSGAVMLWLIVRKSRGGRSGSGNWPSAFALFAYAAGFSFAYVSLPAATGALLLFGAVQATMIGHGIWTGERLRTMQFVGLVLALGGLVGLLLPGLSAPPLTASLLMLGAGVAWGIYSLRGKGGGDPTRVTAGNFLRAVPIAAALSLLLHEGASVDSAGFWYALASGALASGIGYAIWYTALPALKSTHAATVQLSVPVIAALGGVVLLGETLTLRLVLTSVAILGGIALVILEKHRAPSVQQAAQADTASRRR